MGIQDPLRRRATRLIQPTHEQQSSRRFKCGVTFSSGPNDYYGNAKVYYLSGPSGALQRTDTDTIHAVNDDCYLHSGHPQRCKVRTRQGTY
jgi:hypothetical protein